MTKTLGHWLIIPLMSNIASPFPLSSYPDDSIVTVFHEDEDQEENLHICHDFKFIRCFNMDFNCSRLPLMNNSWRLFFIKNG